MFYHFGLRPYSHRYTQLRKTIPALIFAIINFIEEGLLPIITTRNISWRSRMKQLRPCDVKRFTAAINTLNDMLKR